MAEHMPQPVTSGEIWSIGHENTQIAPFIELLRLHSIALVADIRIVPYRRIYPQFNRERLVHDLRAADISYVYLGHELGRLREDPTNWGKYGLPDLDAIAKTPLYQSWLAQLTALAAQQRTALLDLQASQWRGQRERLIGRSLRAVGWQMHHILDDETARENGDAAGAQE